MNSDFLQINVDNARHSDLDLAPFTSAIHEDLQKLIVTQRSSRVINGCSGSYSYWMSEAASDKILEFTVARCFYYARIPEIQSEIDKTVLEFTNES